jgi:hypothetical protein
MPYYLRAASGGASAAPQQNRPSRNRVGLNPVYPGGDCIELKQFYSNGFICINYLL